MSYDSVITHHNTTVNGIRLHYVTGGQGDPLVLLHGYPQTHHAWAVASGVSSGSRLARSVSGWTGKALSRLVLSALLTESRRNY